MNYRAGRPARSAIVAFETISKSALAAACVLAAFALAACGGRGNPDLSALADGTVLKAQIAAFPTKAARKVRVGVMPDAGALPLYLMDDVAEVIPFQSAKERDAALEAGQLDAITGDLVSVIAHQQKGIELRALSVTESRFLLVAGPKFREGNRGGKAAHYNVGISENTVIEYVTDALSADMNGAVLDKISIPQVPVRLEMLRNGQIPVACLTDVMAWGLLSDGFRIVRDQAGTGLEPAVLVVTGELARKRPDDLAAFRFRWNEATDKINANPDAYASLLLEKVRLPNSDYPVPHYRGITLPTEAQVQSVIDWYRKKYGLDRSVSYADLVIR